VLAKVKPAAAWACGICGQFFPRNKYGKAMAERCCTCPSCGAVGQAERIGGRVPTDCRRCCAIKSVASARERAEAAAKYLEEALRAAKRLGVEV
jgi:hypothetical protein